jgi:hypothetical protein
MYPTRNISPAPRRESFVTREEFVTESSLRMVEGKGQPHLEPRTKEVFRRFFVTRPWLRASALRHIHHGGRFDLDHTDFDNEKTKELVRRSQTLHELLRGY